jgi:hypothetical protein
MKRFFGALAAAAVIAAPITAQAQIGDPFQVVITENIYPTGGAGYGGNGGGYLANFTVNFPAPVGERTFTDYLIWCIDAGRGVNLNQPITYSLYSLVDFANGAFTSTANNNHDPDLGDMTRIASLTSTISSTFGSMSDEAKWLYQGSIWSEFDGFTSYGGKPELDAEIGTIILGDPNFDVSQYYVLWNGQNQTFLTKISEPSSALLAFAGMGAFLVAVRRRRLN